jgi:hypothetical protein
MNAPERTSGHYPGLSLISANRYQAGGLGESTVSRLRAAWWISAWELALAEGVFGAACDDDDA